MPLRVETEVHPLRELRWARDLTQERLATLAGVSTRTINNIESGRMLPRIDTRRRLLDVLGQSFVGHRKVFGKLPQELWSQ